VLPADRARLPVLSGSDAATGLPGRARAPDDRGRSHRQGEERMVDGVPYDIGGAITIRPGSGVDGIVEAGERLYGQWHDTVSAGNYDYHTLLQSQHDFVNHCEEARKAMA
jgi:hypothetical protein